MPIQGKVAAILNERDLVINKGENDGVSEGMLFQVTQPDVPVRDPDSGVELGVLVRDKIKVRVIELHEQFSVAKTYETYPAHVPSAFEQAESISRGRTVTRVRKIISESDGQSTVTIGIEGSTVNIGDPVVQIPE
jgi:hypothetical protein